jgi:competence protein ComEC
MFRQALSAFLDAVLAERERWSLWLPVGLGTGVGSYLALPVEPPWWLAPIILGAILAGIVLSRRAPGLRLGLIALAAIVAGFAAIDLRVLTVATPVVTARQGPVVVEGRIVEFEARPGERPRLVLAGPLIAGVALGDAPRRLRLSLDPDMAAQDFAPGDLLRVKAILLPPPGPAMPGAPDHGRSMWFEGIGAVGYAVAGPERLEAGDAGSLARWRHRLALRIGQGMPAPEGAIAAALMVGERGAIPEATEESWRAAGISHILSISGLHLGLAAGLVMFGLRFGLAAIAPISLRRPVKKWAAAIAILSAGAYMVVAGMDVPAQRSFIMTAIVLLAVMVDRLAITLRLVALAAATILLIEPEALMTPGFGMSFASVTGLVAGFEVLRPRIGAWRAASGGGWTQRILLALGTILVSSVIATVATAPFAIAHFGRLSLYGLGANLIAVPITAFVIMPGIVMAALLMPLGLEAPALYVVGQGIAAVDWVAQEVAELPGAALAVPAMGQGALVLFVLAGLCLCLWRGRLRLTALPLLAAAAVAWVADIRDPPLLLAHEEGRAVAAPAGDTLRVLPPGSPGFVVEQWTERLGLHEAEILAREAACRDGICQMVLADGRSVVVIGRPTDTLPCATVVIAPKASLPRRWDCAGLKLVIDRQRLDRTGSFVVEAGEGDRLRVISVERTRGLRPWTPAYWRGRQNTSSPSPPLAGEREGPGALATGG